MPRRFAMQISDILITRAHRKKRTSTTKTLFHSYNSIFILAIVFSFLHFTDYKGERRSARVLP